MMYAVYGASGCGRSIMPVARRQLKSQGVSEDQLVFVDDQPAAAIVNGHRVLRYDEFLAIPGERRFAVLAIANGLVRERLAKKLHEDGVHSWSVRAENAILMDDVEIGEGAILSPFCTLASNIRIGRHFHANLYSYVEHDCVIGNFVTFAPGVKCNGNIVIEDHAYIGTGAMIRQGSPGRPLIIGKGAIVGMGAVVTRDVPAGSTVVGCPARSISKG